MLLGAFLGQMLLWLKTVVEAPQWRVVGCLTVIGSLTQPGVWKESVSKGLSDQSMGDCLECLKAAVLNQ